ncbi:MAG: serine hydrolase [Gemmatimonadetes bacterium]|nr:serine hydrolase [Gemmatimonadota bacterium]
MRRRLITLVASTLGCAPGAPVPAPSPEAVPVAHLGQESQAAQEAQAALVTRLARERLIGADTELQALLDTLGTTPGMAVAVVAGDSLLMSRGFGWASIEERRPVTPRTLFYIASATKAFTAAAISLAAERGELSLDTALSALLPTLRFRAPLDAGAISLRALLTHTGGFTNPAVNFVSAYSGEFTHDGLLAAFDESTPRSRDFAYTNLGYILAAYALERATRHSWQAELHARVFEPAGMRATGFSLTRLAPEEIARPYATHGDGAHPLVPKSDKTMHAAGGVVSTLEDMTRWLRLNLRQGRLDGRQVFPAHAVDSWHARQVPMQGTFQEFSRNGYGLGWYLATFRDEPVTQVLGSYRGYRAHVSFMPRRDLGIVVLANEGRSGAFFPEWVAAALYDRLLGVPDRRAESTRRLNAARELVERIRGTGPWNDGRAVVLPSTINASLLTGRYDGGAFGHMEITARDGGLYARIGELGAFLRPDGGDGFLADLNEGSLEGPSRIMFARADGATPAAALTLDMAPGAKFVRVPP